MSFLKLTSFIVLARGYQKAIEEYQIWLSDILTFSEAETPGWGNSLEWVSERVTAVPEGGSCRMNHAKLGVSVQGSSQRLRPRVSYTEGTEGGPNVTQASIL